MLKSSSALMLAVAASISFGASASSGSHAMYKTIGPDGKVTFSDRPAIESAAQLSVLRSNTLVPVKPMASAGVAGSAAAPSPTVAGTGTVTPAIEKTIVEVMMRVEFARRLYSVCNKTHAAARAFTQAASGWKERNLAAIEHQRKIMMQVVSPAKRAELQEKVADLVTTQLSKVTSLPPNERANACEEAVVAMGKADSDINEPAMMAVAIVPYKK